MPRIFMLLYASLHSMLHTVLLALQGKSSNYGVFKLNLEAPFFWISIFCKGSFMKDSVYSTIKCVPVSLGLVQQNILVHF
jgi:hypothetical protein